MNQAPTQSAVTGGRTRSVGAPTGRPAIHVNGVAKTFVDKTVLHGFDLRVDPGEVHMLLGQNGSGKSTLIKILAGFHQPDEPTEFTVGGRDVAAGSADAALAAGLRFVHQDLGLVGPETVLDNMLYTSGYPTRFGHISRRLARQRVAESLTRVGLDISTDSRIDELSPAQRTGVAIARAMMDTGVPAVALVLDEPTATLPGDEVARLHGILRTATASGVGVLYVTHHLDEVDEIGDHVSVLRDGRLVASGRVAEVKRESIVHALVGGELEQVEKLAEELTAPSEYNHVLCVENLVGDHLDGFSFDASAGEIVGLYGLTGSGREAALGTVFGARSRVDGTVRVGANEVPPGRPAAAMAAGMSYVSPDRKASDE